MEKKEITKKRCPYCNYLGLEYESLDGDILPQEGDISFCISCGEASQFWNDGLLKIDINKLEKGIREDVKNLEIAWLQIQQRKKFKNG